MTLFFVGVTIFVILIASYSQRGGWLACCSTIMSIAVFTGWLLIPTVENPSKVRSGLTWLFRQLPSVLDQQTLDHLAAAIAQSSTAASCDAKNETSCATAASHTVSPIANKGAEVPRSPISTDEAAQAHATLDRLVAAINADEASGSPVIWLRPSVGSVGTPRSLISGINASNVTLKMVRATLKPDATQREVALALNVSANKLTSEDAIPPGARFTLALKTAPTDNEKQVGGAIFAFRYTYVGRQRTTIWYLTPAMLVRFAKLE